MAFRGQSTPIPPVLPTPASSPPPGVAVLSDKGSASNQYALADHTHASSVQRKRVTATSGTFTWTFAPAYASIPVVTYGVEGPSGTNLPYVVNIVSITNTAVTFNIYRSQTTTLGGTLAAIIGMVVAPFAPAPTVTLHCWAALPTP